MNNSNQRKAEKLGMPFGTANSILSKSLLFDFAKRLNLLSCFQCEDQIETIEEFSKEHKEPWFNATDPIKAFFDLDNIAFSHIKCNVKAGLRPHKTYPNLLEKGRAYTERRRDNPARYAKFLELKRRRWAEGYRWPKLSGSSPTEEANGLSPL